MAVRITIDVDVTGRADGSLSNITTFGLCIRRGLYPAPDARGIGSRGDTENTAEAVPPPRAQNIPPSTDTAGDSSRPTLIGMRHLPSTTSRSSNPGPEEIVLDGWLDAAEPYVSLRETRRAPAQSARTHAEALPEGRIASPLRVPALR
jgi:hypothetical protein